MPVLKLQQSQQGQCGQPKLKKLFLRRVQGNHPVGRDKTGPFFYDADGTVDNIGNDDQQNKHAGADGVVTPPAYCVAQRTPAGHCQVEAGGGDWQQDQYGAELGHPG